MGVLQVLTLTGRPFLEQKSAGIFATKKGSQGLFEGATEQHCRTGVLLFPSVKVAVAIAPRARQVLADLCVAVGHSGYLRVIQVRG